MRPGGNVSKGKEGERQVCKLLQPVVTDVYTQLRPGHEVPVVVRNLDQSRAGGFDLHGVAGMCIEVKWHKKPSLNPWWAQTVAQADIAGGDPVLIYKSNFQPWRVMLYGSPGCAVWVPSVLEMDNFLLYLHARLRNNLMREEE